MRDVGVGVDSISYSTRTLIQSETCIVLLFTCGDQFMSIDV